MYKFIYNGNVIESTNELYSYLYLHPEMNGMFIKINEDLYDVKQVDYTQHTNTFKTRSTTGGGNNYQMIFTLDLVSVPDYLADKGYPL